MILTPPFAAVVPIALPLSWKWTDTEPAPLPPLHVDPLAWSRDGKTWPTELRVKPVENGRAEQFVRAEVHRKWQAVVTGDTAAKSSRRFLEPDAAESFDVAELEPGDVLEVGRIERARRASFSSCRTNYVVVERTQTRLVLAIVRTKAQALKAGNLRKAIGAERETLLAGRAAVWEDLNRERSSAEVEDDEAIAEAFM